MSTNQQNQNQKPEHKQSANQDQLSECDSEDFQIDIPFKNEPNTLDVYMEEEGLTQQQQDYLQQTIEEMQRCPAQYFNFGFSLEDYKAYLRKIIWMKAERQIVETMILKSQKYPGLKEECEEQTRLQQQQQMGYHNHQRKVSNNYN